MATILSINDMSDIRCTIVIGIFCIKKKEFKNDSKHVRAVSTVVKFSRVKIEDVIQNGVPNVLQNAK